MGELIAYDQMFDHLADLFETVNWSKGTLTEAGNTLIQRIAFDSDPANKRTTDHIYDQCKTIAAMLNALYSLVQHHSEVEGCLDYTSIIPYISSYDEDSTDTVLYLLACTGDMKYMELIEKESARFPAIPTDEYKKELMFRAKRSEKELK